MNPVLFISKSAYEHHFNTQNFFTTKTRKHVLQNNQPRWFLQANVGETSKTEVLQTLSAIKSIPRSEG